jgi:hypothetical protein
MEDCIYQRCQLSTTQVAYSWPKSLQVGDPSSRLRRPHRQQILFGSETAT